ncbi:Disintegrin and metalloproteinase domain-containing protein [Sparassis crispa]|uniref:Disintegrin and metalloproteinase domain-containing protein B n=1 Tax=Sparassis crispa TaxID=139825 RepID=A0A401G995_9APHY|nr:Disintegrin and metalloproteinase domain-containing protein [Sparassis crispa]GBE78703.1 Disintegrin and metalloproteinase domain-containing protein [Sparassis crispa]
MYFYCWIPALVIALFLNLDVVSASSSPARPLKRVEHPSILAIEILPRKPSSRHGGRRALPLDSSVLTHSDTFRLKLSAFGDVYHLHLRPNEHLIHPAARISHYHTSPDGQNVRIHTEPLLRGSVKAYWGEVVPADASPDRLREDAAGVIARPWTDPALGWARIVVHHQGDAAKGIAPLLEGGFSVNGVVHHVMTKDNYLRNKLELDPHISLSDADADSTLVVWRDSDMMGPHEYAEGNVHTCGHDNLSYNTDPSLNSVLRKPSPSPLNPWYDPLGLLNTRNASDSGPTKRDDVAGGSMSSNFSGNIGSTFGCPTTEMIVYMGVAADCEYTSHYGSKENATQQILTNWNSASALYKSTFNVTLGIIELQVQDSSCPNATDPAVPWNVACSSSISLNERLSLFSGWRGQKGNDGAGLWHLMSGCPSGTEVGVAWLATLCQQSSSGSAPSIVSGTAVTTAGRTEWQVASHEIGHNFGAIHDCTNSCGLANSTVCCPLSATTCNANSQFVMNPVTESSEMAFSQCTVGNICSLMMGNIGAEEMTNTTCLVDPNRSQQLITMNMCGNGIVEEGEECDPGRGSNSTCCDVSTCKFTAGAVCDPDSSPCCTAQCSFSPATQVCGAALDPTCDTTEMCTGNSSACPADLTAPNGKSCGSNGLACASGQCTSLNVQCQMVGASMNLTTACPNKDSKSCQVSCINPADPGQCIILQSDLIDGSPCGYGGTCNSGICQPGSAIDTFDAWYRQNLDISVPVTIALAVVLLLVIYAIYRCCTAERRKKVQKGSDKRALHSSEPALARTRAYRIGDGPSGAHAARSVGPVLRSSPEGRWTPQVFPKTVQAARTGASN